MYKKLADVYDQMYHFKDYDEESAYIIGKIREHIPAARSLLEVACGTGRFLDFLSKDFDAEGLDLSWQMLAKARSRLGDIPLHQGNMTDFELGHQFDVVCCLFRSIAHCKTADGFNKAILSMARHVAPGGLLAIEPFFTPKTFWDNNVVLNEYKGEDMKLAWMYVGQRQGTQVNLNIHCLVGTPSGVSHFTELVELGLFTPEQYAESFRAAGLQLDYDPLGPSGIGLYVGHKPLE